MLTLMPVHVLSCMYWKLNALSVPLREILQITMREFLQGMSCRLQYSVLFPELFCKLQKYPVYFFVCTFGPVSVFFAN